MAGKIINAEINKEPTKFIANTTIEPTTTENIIFIFTILLPEVVPKSSSNVNANILLYITIYIIITTIDNITHIYTSESVRVKIDVEPNNVVQTSPAKFAPVANRFNNKYPNASEPTDNKATAESPETFLPFRANNQIAKNTVINNITGNSATPNIPAIPIEQNATLDNPVPINEYCFNTNVTPISEEHNAINTPTTNAYCTNVYPKYISILAN